MPTRQPDELAAILLQRGDLIVDRGTGAITRRDGTRAEHLDRRDGTGRVVVHHRPRVIAAAHRIVWIAVHGHIPPDARIRHANGMRWDNRPTNLRLYTPSTRSATT